MVHKKNAGERVDMSALAKDRMKKLSGTKFKCPVHGPFVGLPKWAAHRRWCKAGAKGVGGRPPKEKSSKSAGTKHRITRTTKPLRRLEKSEVVITQDTLFYGSHKYEIVLRNGKDETKLATVICGKEGAKELPSRLRDVIRKLVEKA